MPTERSGTRVVEQRCHSIQLSLRHSQSGDVRAAPGACQDFSYQVPFVQGVFRSHLNRQKVKPGSLTLQAPTFFGSPQQGVYYVGGVTSNALQYIGLRGYAL